MPCRIRRLDVIFLQTVQCQQSESIHAPKAKDRDTCCLSTRSKQPNHRYLGDGWSTSVGRCEWNTQDLRIIHGTMIRDAPNRIRNKAGCADQRNPNRINLSLINRQPTARNNHTPGVLLLGKSQPRPSLGNANHQSRSICTNNTRLEATTKWNNTDLVQPFQYWTVTCHFRWFSLVLAQKIIE